MEKQLQPQYVDTEKCIYMKELERPYYNQWNLNHLKTIIRRDGFKSQYAPRAIFDETLNKFLVFDGNHRLQIAKELGIKQIPITDETKLLTRSQAIAEGIKANTSQAYYNAIDVAINAKNLLKSLSSETQHESVGRPPTGIADVAEILGQSERQVRNYMNLLELPKDTQELIGQGKLHMSKAIVLLKLRDTPYFDQVSKIAEDVSRNGISRKELNKIVSTILKKGVYQEDKKMCLRCQKGYSKDSLKHSFLCPDCLGKVRSGRFEDSKQRRTIAMLRFLTLRNWAEKKHREGFELPAWFFERLEELQIQWKGDKIGF